MFVLEADVTQEHMKNRFKRTTRNPEKSLFTIVRLKLAKDRGEVDCWWERIPHSGTVSISASCLLLWLG